MGEQLAKLFVDPAQVGLEEGGCTGGTGGGFGGMCQLLFLGGVYGFILFKGSNMISDGAEMLELVPSIRGVVGAVVLPVLGAVPDGAIVLFSGMGDNAKKELDVGVGCLAGSTIMLLTLPWALSIYAGRVDLDQDGNGNYKPLPDDNGKRCKLSASKQLDLSKVTPAIATAALSLARVSDRSELPIICAQDWVVYAHYSAPVHSHSNRRFRVRLLPQN